MHLEIQPTVSIPGGGCILLGVCWVEQVGGLSDDPCGLLCVPVFLFPYYYFHFVGISDRQTVYFCWTAINWALGEQQQRLACVRFPAVVVVTHVFVVPFPVLCVVRSGACCSRYCIWIPVIPGLRMIYGAVGRSRCSPVSIIRYLPADSAIAGVRCCCCALRLLERSRYCGIVRWLLESTLFTRLLLFTLLPGARYPCDCCGPVVIAMLLRLFPFVVLRCSSLFVSLISLRFVILLLLRYSLPSLGGLDGYLPLLRCCLHCYPELRFNFTYYVQCNAPTCSPHQRIPCLCFPTHGGLVGWVFRWRCRCFGWPVPAVCCGCVTGVVVGGDLFWWCITTLFWLRLHYHIEHWLFIRCCYVLPLRCICSLTFVVCLRWCILLIPFCWGCMRKRKRKLRKKKKKKKNSYIATNAAAQFVGLPRTAGWAALARLVSLHFCRAAGVAGTMCRTSVRVLPVLHFARSGVLPAGVLAMPLT